jgi:hypothetical protein
MPDKPSYDALHERIRAAIDDLDSVGESESDQTVAQVDSQIFSAALKTALIAFSASLGECRRATPFSPLHPVIDASGDFHWCCNHDPEHCS